MSNGILFCSRQTCLDEREAIKIILLVAESLFAFRYIDTLRSIFRTTFVYLDYVEIRFWPIPIVFKMTGPPRLFSGRASASNKAPYSCIFEVIFVAVLSFRENVNLPNVVWYDCVWYCYNLICLHFNSMASKYLLVI